MSADSKTEKATPKRRQDERKKGNVFVSKDVAIVASLLCTFFSLKLLFPFIYSNIKEYMLRFIDFSATKTELSETFAYEIATGFVFTFFKITIVLFLITISIPVVATVFQTKPMFVTDSLKPKFSRLNPLQGFKRIFSMKSFVNVLIGVIKISILFYILYDFIKGLTLLLPKMMYTDINVSCGFILKHVIKLAVKIGIAFVAISAADYIYQLWEFEKQIKMSKQEVKEEYKQMEGDPLIKGKIKDAQRKVAMSRMMQAVPSADVVIRNPTHFAVALKYDMGKDSAPIMVAKGQDEIALRIVKVAQDNGVYVMENRPLARAIFFTTDLNREIPMEFYGTIAEILIYVYKLNNKEIM